jgi:hypothetical protein
LVFDLIFGNKKTDCVGCVVGFFLWEMKKNVEKPYFCTTQTRFSMLYQDILVQESATLPE